MKESILNKIIVSKKKEVAERKSLYPVALLERSLYYQAAPVSLMKYILRDDLNGIIAEFKRKSPSEGEINPYAKAEAVTLKYMQSGASALSVLTDGPFFGGSLADLEDARRVNYCPVLRKDFMVDEYQVVEARAGGADAVLLIAAALDTNQIRRLGDLAMSLGMEVLFEMHEESELSDYRPEFIAGVNSRSLHDFTVDITRAEKMSALLPSSSVKVAESGIRSPEDVLRLRCAGYKGFLIGTHFMKQADPGKGCARFIRELNSLSTVVENYPEASVC